MLIEGNGACPITFAKNLLYMSKVYHHLTQEQRYKLEALLKAGVKKTLITAQLGIDKSTLYRELKRNKKKRGGYNGTFAQELSYERKERFSIKRKMNMGMEKFITLKLTREQWSPEQIKGYCDAKGIEMVSHERIYQFIWEDKSQGGTLYKDLRTGDKKYRKRYGSGKASRGITNRTSIEERPEIVDQKLRFGDWEIDTIIGKNRKGAIVVIVERKSGFFLMKKLKGKDAAELAKAVIRLLAPFKSKVFTITSDNGLEFAKHETIANKLEARFYFAHPYSSWERGLSENTNKLVRQYIPKKTSFENITDMEINEITMKINKRPRKKLGFKNPLFVFLSSFNKNVALAS
jgi:transposase, IS30 family